MTETEIKGFLEFCMNELLVQAKKNRQPTKAIERLERRVEVAFEWLQHAELSHTLKPLPTTSEYEPLLDRIFPHDYFPAVTISGDDLTVDSVFTKTPEPENTVVIHCDYIEGKPETYEGMIVVVPRTGDIEAQYYSDDPLMDLLKCRQWALQHDKTWSQNPLVDAFLMGYERLQKPPLPFDEEEVILI